MSEGVIVPPEYERQRTERVRRYAEQWKQKNPPKTHTYRRHPLRPTSNRRRSVRSIAPDEVATERLRQEEKEKLLHKGNQVVNTLTIGAFTVSTVIGAAVALRIGADTARDIIEAMSSRNAQVSPATIQNLQIPMGELKERLQFPASYSFAEGTALLNYKNEGSYFTLRSDEGRKVRGGTVYTVNFIGPDNEDNEKYSFDFLIADDGSTSITPPQTVTEGSE